MPAVTISARAYAHRSGYRYRLSAGQGRVRWAPMGKDEQEARELAELTVAGYQQEIGILVSDLRDGYLQHLRDNDRLPSSVRGVGNKLLQILGPMFDLEAGAVTAARAKARYLQLVPSCAAATHQAALDRAKECWRWAVKQGMVRSNPWAEVERVGRAKRGKAKLTIDETNRLVEACLQDVDTSDRALAILVLIFCGVRVSEVTRRQVRDVDAGGTRLNIPSAKTRAGERAPAIPEVIQAAVQLRCTGRPSTAPLLRNTLGGHPHGDWVRLGLKAYCARAGVPFVTAHALRGGWADIAYSAGELSHRVAAALGHSSARVTERHYAASGVVADAKQARRLAELKGVSDGKK